MTLCKCCLNAVKTLLAECPPVKMCMYTEQEVLRWIDAELDNEAHIEMLVLGAAEVEGWVKEHDQLLQKKKKVPPPLRISHQHQRKGNHPNLKVFSLFGIYFTKACGGRWLI